MSSLRPTRVLIPSLLLSACIGANALAADAAAPATPAAAAPATPAAAAAPAAPAAAPDPATPADPKLSSYSAGISFGNQLHAAGVGDQVSMDDLMNGIKAGLAGTAQTMQDRQRLVSWVGQARDRMRLRNEAAASEFLATNSKVAGVVTTASGLQYKVLTDGLASGSAPTANDRVKVNYSGRLLNGTEFDSSYKRGQPAVFQVGGVIPGWTEALQLMKPGAKWQLFVPPALAYGSSPPPNSPIEPGAALVFDVELLSVEPRPVLGSNGTPKAPAGAKPKPKTAAPAAAKKPKT